jgi:nickel-dependent lactate racemase
MDRFPVYNHNPYENCTLLGKTSRGTPVSINAEVMSCDLKIGIGCIVPHPLTGFGGGGKIIVPGVASIDTIEANHGPLLARSERSQTGTGKFEENLLRLDILEAAKMAGLDIKIDTIVNAKRETSALFIGEVEATHKEGVRLAKEVYATPKIEGMDVVIANAYSKGNEAMLAVPIAAELLKESGGDVVLIVNTPEGQITHYIMRSFGKRISGRLWRPRTRLPRKVKRLFVLAPYKDKAGADWIAPLDSIVWAKTWDEVLAELRIAYAAGAKAAVIPDATIQYLKEP